MSSIKSSFRSSLRSLAQVQHNPGFSITQQILKRLWIDYGYLQDRWKSRSFLNASLSGIRAFAGFGIGREAIVIANGPSVNDLNLKRVGRGKSSDIDVFAVNSFLLTDLAKTISPTHYLLSDPSHSPHETNDTARQLWEELDRTPEIQLFAPHSWYPFLRERRPDALYFNDCGREGRTTNISPLKARGYISLTAYKALAAAVHLRYDKIFVIGFDNTFHLSCRLDEGGRTLYGGSTHFYSEESPDLDASEVYPQGMADALFDSALSILELQRCFSLPNILNLDKNSNTLAFQRFTDERFSKFTE